MGGVLTYRMSSLAEVICQVCRKHTQLGHNPKEVRRSEFLALSRNQINRTLPPTRMELLKVTILFLKNDTVVIRSYLSLDSKESDPCQCI